ncbi:MAG: hypothetical protein U9Q79_06010 [Candidatus Hydrogenedentes bacterium]|nr:hypothetical protein [Candidatus Hydrogenedentota bacterium]
MIIDANTWIGHWAFRALPQRSAKDLLKQMDGLNIDKALVGNLNGLLYKDVHESNHELTRELKRHRDRLVPCALINPTYDGWRDDLRQCREEFGMPVIRLTPDYHGYALADPCTLELISAAHELKMRVAFYWRIVDSRGRHRLDPGREANETAVRDVLKQFPKAHFLMLNFPRVLDKPRPKADCLYDLTLFMGRNGLRLMDEIAEHGAKTFAVGTTMLLRYGSAPLLALEKCKLAKRDREAIQWRNIVNLAPDLK